MWKQYLRELIDEFKHPAWGLAHSLWIYEVSLRLAEEQGAEVDKGALHFELSQNTMSQRTQ